MFNFSPIPISENIGSIVQFKSVGLRYGRGPEILRDISMELSAGSFYFLTGSSGAGKSSLLSMLHLARRSTRGRQFMFGQDVCHMSRHRLTLLRRRIGMVFQDFRLLDHLSALDNVALPLRVRGVREKDIQKHVPELLDWVGLSKHINDTPPTLSGGQKQRVAIARAVIGRPDILLADEPTGNVDDVIALRLLRLFTELNRLGTTVLIATHNKTLVSRLSHIPRMHIDRGELIHVAETPTETLEESPDGEMSGETEAKKDQET